MEMGQQTHVPPLVSSAFVASRALGWYASLRLQQSSTGNASRSPRAAQGAEREISRNLEHPAHSPVTKRRTEQEERATVDPADPLLDRFQPAWLPKMVGNALSVRTFETTLLVHLTHSNH